MILWLVLVGSVVEVSLLTLNVRQQYLRLVSNGGCMVHHDLSLVNSGLYWLTITANDDW